MSNLKIKTQDELAETVKKARLGGRKVGFTNGCFDILHKGHVRYLGSAREKCDMLVVGVNSDDSVRKLKGENRPVNSQEARMEVLSALESVDFLTLFKEDTPEDLIKKLTPDILFKGGDWDEKSVVGADHVKAQGGRVCIIPYVEGFSTTDILKKINAGR